MKDEGGRMSGRPWFWIIGGSNGSGKTTFSLEYLPAVLKTKDFVNADLIAAGLSPLDPDSLPAYRALADRWLVFDNSGDKARLVAAGEEGEVAVLNAATAAMMELP